MWTYEHHISHTMKAAQINKYGGSEVVEINTNVPKPALSAGKVLVAIHAAGVNPIDWKVRQGYMEKFSPLQFPSTLGGDFSGVIEELGGDVSNFQKGDEVYGTAIVLGGGSGSFAEYSSANIKSIAQKPKGLSHREAAALPLTGVSALQALIEHIGLSKNQKILIHGGAGGIGSFAIQLGKHLGAYVAATASAEDAAYVKTLGADTVIDYKTQIFENELHNYDAVFDTVGGETYKRSFKVLKRGGVIVSMLEQPDTTLMKQYEVRSIAQGTQINTERLTALAQLAEKGVIKVHIDKTFPFEQAGGALTYLQEGRPKGKVVIDIRNN